MTVSARRPIRRLPGVVADAIAAGEVVERPASVVKELCENALDAGATRIDVEVDGGGLVRIVVSDDGGGIATGEMALSVERHATSKIAGLDDLAAVASLGFRGEALASIAAVSELCITSATDATPAGSRLLVRGGETVESGASARARGTTVEVRDLFFNTPARLRFLKSQRAESSAVGRVVAELALTHPDVAFTCTVESRRSLRTPGGTLQDAASAVFGPSAAAELLDIDAPGAVGVHGCIAQPRAHRGSRASLVLVVNGRRVHNRALQAAVDEAYRGLLPGGRYTYGVVVIDVDPSDVDVNVHPTKREVRFHDERAVFAAVQRACWGALQDAAVYQAPSAWEALGIPATTGGAVLEFGDGLPPRSPSADGSPHRSAFGDVRDAGMGGAPGIGRSAPAAGDHEVHLRGIANPGTRPIERVSDLDGLRPLGQVGGTWLVAGSETGIVIVDPHAAHEKILYERILAGWRRTRLDASDSDHVQLLLIPALIECDPARMAALAQHGQWLHDCGLHVEAFGEGVVRCTAVPAASSAVDAEALVADVLDSLGESAGRDEERRHRAAALIACHSAIRFGDTLGDREQATLLTDLASTPGALTCPHGRPTVMILDAAMLRRAFRRPAV